MSGASVKAGKDSVDSSTTESANSSQGNGVKGAIKAAFSLLCTLIVLPVFASYYVLGLVTDRDGLFAGYAQLMSLIPGKIGSYLRNSFYRLTMNQCDEGVVISFGTLFSQRDTDIGTGTYIGPQCNFGSCAVGKDCLIGSGVHILSGKRQHAIGDLDTPIREQGGELTKVKIGDDCWIGNGAIIMADVGSQCVIAAGAVVVDAVEDRTIVGGNPAQLIRRRQ
jgi:acetyltransferase-like isoleucine patch superfamily enzyme